MSQALTIETASRQVFAHSLAINTSLVMCSTQGPLPTPDKQERVVAPHFL